MKLGRGLTLILFELPKCEEECCLPKENLFPKQSVEDRAIQEQNAKNETNKCCPAQVVLQTVFAN